MWSFHYHQKYRFGARCRRPRICTSISVSGRRQYRFETYFSRKGWKSYKSTFSCEIYIITRNIDLVRGVAARTHLQLFSKLTPHTLKSVSWSCRCARTPTVPFWNLFWFHILWKSSKSTFLSEILIIIRSIDLVRGIGARAHLQIVFKTYHSFMQNCFMIIQVCANADNTLLNHNLVIETMKIFKISSSRRNFYHQNIALARGIGARAHLQLFWKPTPPVFKASSWSYRYAQTPTIPFWDIICS